MEQASVHSRYELELRSAHDYANPLQDVQVTVEFQSGAHRETVRAFWDGGRRWLARFSPSRTGPWQWRSLCSTPADNGLHDIGGEFLCVPVANPPNDLLRHGPLRVSPDRRHLIHSDGHPFFWLGDTVWNGPLKSSEADWALFLADRARKGFNVIQFVSTQWIAAAGDAEARPAYLGADRILIEPAFFRRLDRRIDAINDLGMVAAPVLCWAAGWNPLSAHFNPGNSLSEDQLIVLVQYLVSRYGAHHAVWLLAGDGLYEGEEAARWRRIGRAALGDGTHLATMHPGGKIWALSEYREEPWFSFHGYQSGHWNDDDNCRWITAGPLSLDWPTEPRCPHINLEPCYEGHLGMATGVPIDAHDVRRACYWSLLAAPTAGVTYGAHGVWSWENYPELPMSHPATGVCPAWRDAMHLPGSESMAHLKAIFTSIEWWRLNPSPHILQAQPGAASPAHFIAASASDDGKLAVLYLPVGGSVQLHRNLLAPHLLAECLDPATGKQLWQRILGPAEHDIDSSGPGDRVLVLRESEWQSRPESHTLGSP